MKKFFTPFVFFLLAVFFISPARQVFSHSISKIKSFNASFVPVLNNKGALIYLSGDTSDFPGENDAGYLKTEDDDENEDDENGLHQYAAQTFLCDNLSLRVQSSEASPRFFYVTSGNAFGSDLKTWSVRRGNSAIF